jgi:hypothetical protein
MESNAKAELHEADRLARKARAAATDYPTSAQLLMIGADLVLIGIFIAFGFSARMAAGWIAFLVVFFVALRLRRRARPQSPWATPESRRRFLKTLGVDVVVNAVWIPLFFLARPVALALLVAALLWSLYGTVKYRHA